MQVRTTLVLLFENVARAKIIRLMLLKIANGLIFQSAARMMIAFLLFYQVSCYKDFRTSAIY